MSNNFFSIKKIGDIFGVSGIKEKLGSLEKDKLIPSGQKFRSGAIYQTGWSIDDLPSIGEQIGFIKNFSYPVAISVFTTKGGVLKSTLALNLARIAAIHNIKTCVVGLDIQGDITTTLGHEPDIEDDSNIDQIIESLSRTKGLPDLFNGQVRINEIVCETDLKNLFLIPETPELVALNDYLSNINRREYWLKEKVLPYLKEHFDLIIFDCSPNWNKLTTNALVACDALVSPLECKINNFRNFKIFKHFLNEFREDMHLQFENIYVPTRFSANKKLSIEIKNWYHANLANCTTNGIRESVLGEEATALHKSILENSPNKEIAIELRALFVEIFSQIEQGLIKCPKIIEKPFMAFSDTSLN